MNDQVIIKRLGGLSEVAARLSEITGSLVSVKRVSNWPLRGIPPEFKPAIAAMLLERGESVPNGFCPGLSFDVHNGTVFATSGTQSVTDEVPS